MTSRRSIVAGNWKMNKQVMEAFTLTSYILTETERRSEAVEIVLAPPAPYLYTINNMVKNAPQLRVAAQNCHYEASGAFTGEISAPMLSAMELEYVILGHSERRKYFHEDHALLAKKVSAAVAAGLKVIFCCGEPLEIREAGTEQSFVLQQLKESLFHLNAEQMAQIVVAYEPVWAIGTGKTASPEQAQAMHAFIRQELEQQYNEAIATACPILYGGSCKPSNATELFAQADVDGGLVGGASLNMQDFMAIVDACIKQL